MLRLPDKPAAVDLEVVILTLADGLAGVISETSLPLGDLAGRLWIMERGRIRLFEETDRD